MSGIFRIVHYKQQPHMNLHRILTPAEEADFRKWARENHKIGADINTGWHPVVIHEIGVMTLEQYDIGKKQPIYGELDNLRRELDYFIAHEPQAKKAMLKIEKRISELQNELKK